MALLALCAGPLVRELIYMNNFFANRRMLVLITFLVVVLFGIFILRILTKTEDKPLNQLPSVSPSLTPIASSSAQIISSQPLPYPPGALNKDYKRIITRSELSSTDLQVKEKLLKSLAGKSGIITTEAGFQIEYVKSADSFMVEVTQKDPELGKKEAEKYFLDVGLSQEGICTLPVVFYLSSSLQKELLDSGKMFNPVPTGC
jgi:hypothetical protein